MGKSRRPGSDLRRFLGLPFWQGVGALAAILAIIVSIVIAFLAQQGDSVETRTQVNRDGGCAVQGDGNIVQCAPTAQPKSMGSVKFTWAQGAAGFLFKGAAEDLPKPPPYPAEEINGHCDEWERWRRAEPRVYEVMNQAELSMIGTRIDSVAIREVRTQVFRKIPLSKPYVFVTCTRGAGLDAGFYIENTLKDNTTTYQDASGEARHPMPPASAHLGKSGFTSGLVLINSSTDYLYDGKVIIKVVINGVEREYQYGTDAQPLRWVGGGLDRYGKAETALQTYDWDLGQKTWAKSVSTDSSPAKSCTSGREVIDPTGQRVSTWMCPVRRSGDVYASPESTESTGVLREGVSWFVCQKHGRSNPSVDEAKSDIWLYTQGDVAISDRGWGWFPATFISYSEDSQPVPGVPAC